MRGLKTAISIHAIIGSPIIGRWRAENSMLLPILIQQVLLLCKAMSMSVAWASHKSGSFKTRWWQIPTKIKLPASSSLSAMASNTGTIHLRSAQTRTPIPSLFNWRNCALPHSDSNHTRSVLCNNCHSNILKWTYFNSQLTFRKPCTYVIGNSIFTLTLIYIMLHLRIKLFVVFVFNCSSP